MDCLWEWLFGLCRRGAGLDKYWNRWRIPARNSNGHVHVPVGWTDLRLYGCRYSFSDSRYNSGFWAKIVRCSFMPRQTTDSGKERAILTLFNLDAVIEVFTK